MWTGEQIARAAAGLRRRHRVDDQGLAPVAVAGAALVVPEAVRSAFCSLAASGECMSSRVVVGHALGKKPSCPTVDNIRVTIPLNTIMGVLDVVIADDITTSMLCSMPCPVGGGHVRGSSSRMALVARLTIEKALDRRSAGAVGQGDVRQFYDHVPVAECRATLVDDGIAPATAQVAFRHQKCSPV